MESKEYRTLLGQLPIKSPTKEDMARLCPHLTPEQAVEAFTTGSSNYVACPSLRIRNGFQIISYYGESIDTEKNKNRPARLDWSFAGRTIESYANGKPQGDVFDNYKHTAEAIQFAEKNWGSELILDSWVSVGQIYIQDPTDLFNDKYHKDRPRTKAVLRVTLNRDLNKIINDHSKPESELFDEQIAEMTMDEVIWHEIKGGRGGYIHFNCAFCGSGLGLTSCSGCGFTYEDDGFRYGWRTPLSRKMVEFLRDKGHVFGKDPEIAWKKEREEWEKENMRQREQT